MVCAHKRYNLGDQQAWNTEYYNNWNEWLENEIIRSNGGWNNVIALPLYLLDHSLLCISTEAFYHIDPWGWDWGQVGWIYVTKPKVRQVFGIKRVTSKIEKRVKEILKAEVEIYSEYLEGNV